jgi:hypothetical protein
VNEWKPDICVYHGNCDDGFGAAWVVRKRWPNVEFVPGAYSGTKWPAGLSGKNVLFVDFSLKRDAMIEFTNGGLPGEVPRSVVVLDHHKTAEAELKDWDWGPVTADSHADIGIRINKAAVETALPIAAHFDMQHSGAQMTWDFCFPGEPVPALIAHIEDRDLWRFAMVNTPTVSAALRTYPHDFHVWDNFDCNALDRDGRSILRGHRKNVETFITNRYWTEIGGVRVPVVNVPYHYASDCADAMLKAEPDAPFCAAWFQRADGKVQYSLRSRDDRMDVSEIAKKFGGGGHRNAAGFEAAA